MARDRGAQCKQCRREGVKLFLKGERCLTDKCGVERRTYPPGEHGRGRSKQSEYRLQLREKQKARRYYGVLARQFANYYEKASRQEGVTGENLLRLLEARLDNVLVRLGFAASRRQARQLILHGHWTVNGRRVNVPSYQVKPDDVIAVKGTSSAQQVIRDATDLVSAVPPWENGALLPEAKRVLDEQDEGALMGGPRFEQVSRATGTLRVGDRQHRIAEFFGAVGKYRTRQCQKLLPHHLHVRE